MNIPTRFRQRGTITSWKCGYRDGYEKRGDNSHLRTKDSFAQDAYKDGYETGRDRREKREKKAA